MNDASPSPQPASAPLLVLASQSPGRAQILRQAGIAFEQIVSDVDEEKGAALRREELDRDLSPAETALFLAQLKAEAVAALPQAQERLIVGCDSVFEFEGKPYGKPYTPERAAERLRAQSRGTGVLHSGLWLVDNRTMSPGTNIPGASGRVTSTSVTFSHIMEPEIQAYVTTEEPLHCAGSFTIDGRGAAFIERIDGDPAAVVGISVAELRERLMEHGLLISDLWA